MIIVGLVAFLVALSIPLLYTAAAGGEKRPDLEMPAGETKCVRDREWMVGNHMQLLLDWRDKVVRDGQKFETVNGVEIEMSLVKNCLGCHSNKAAFCDRCHEYADIQPDCWECHVEPKGK
jgi:hypothetical protein